MLRLIHSLVILVFLLSGELAPSAWATILVDEFNDDTLDLDWNIAFTDDGGGWTFEETGGQLVVTDVVDTASDNDFWGRVLLTRDAGSLITGDFTFETAFSWDSDNSLTAIQSVRVGLYDDSSEFVTTAMHNDAWLSFTGGPFASTPSAQTFLGNNLAPLAGTSTVTMQRVGGQVTIDFDEYPTIGHVSTYSGPIRGVYIEYSFFGFDGGPSLFGTESVDYVRLTDSPVPEPATVTLLLACGIFSCLYAGARTGLETRK